MATILTDILSSEKLGSLQSDLAEANWRDGSATAGRQSAGVKSNHQLDAADPLATKWSKAISAVLIQHAGFFTAALPRKLTPMMFSRYTGGEQYGLHIDNAIRPDPTGHLRTDLAATMFLSDPASYDGGELMIETGFGTSSIKLPAGQVLLYPATTLHRVAPVTRGSRLAAVFWVQSMVREDADRAMLLDLDRSVQALSATLGTNQPHILTLTRTYHNLLRRWADV